MIGGKQSIFGRVRVNTFNLFGSTNTMILRFTNILANIGGAITYTDSATLGATFTINKSGNYAISFTHSAVAAALFGISINSSQLTTAISSITAADRLAFEQVAANQAQSVAWVGYLPAGSVIRAHSDGAGAGANPIWTNFDIQEL